MVPDFGYAMHADKTIGQGRFHNHPARQGDSERRSAGVPASVAVSPAGTPSPDLGNNKGTKAASRARVPGLVPQG